jgi:hypothetical protein
MKSPHDVKLIISASGFCRGDDLVRSTAAAGAVKQLAPLMVADLRRAQIRYGPMDDLA